MREDVHICGISTCTGFQIFDLNGIRIKTKDFIETADVRRWRKALQIRLWMEKPFSQKIFIMLAVLGAVFPAVASTLYYCIFHNAYLLIFGAVPFLACASWLLVMLGSFLTEIIIEKWWDLREWWQDRRGIQDICLDDKLREWHSCEHKIIHLLEQRQKITISAVQKTPDFHLNCGEGKGQKQLDWLKEPSLAKIKETVRVSKEYYRKLQEKNKNKKT